MILPFTREHQPHIEILRVRDRYSGSYFYVFELVGRDKDGPFRIDMSHRYTLNEVADETAMWWREGIEVDGSDALIHLTRGCR